MGFERFLEYKRTAGRYTGPFIETNELALNLRENCPKAWVKVRPNNKKIWPGEKRCENKNPITGEDDPGSVWMYRPTDAYEEIGFSILYLRFQKTIYHNWSKIHKYVDLDHYLDETENWLCQTIRHYDPSKNASFKTLANTMLSNCAINCINENTSIHYIKDENKNQVYEIVNGKKCKKKVIEYHQQTLSLDEIMDDPENPNNYNLPKQSMDTFNTLDLLKEKYKKEKDLVSWALVDWQLPQSQVLSNPQILDSLSKIDPETKELVKIKDEFNSKNFKKAYEKILSSDLYKEFGFDMPTLKAIFTAIEQQKLPNTVKNKQKDKAFNRAYARSIKTLQEDVQEYEMIM